MTNEAFVSSTRWPPTLLNGEFLQFDFLIVNNDDFDRLGLNGLTATTNFPSGLILTLLGRNAIEVLDSPRQLNGYPSPFLPAHHRLFANRTPWSNRLKLSAGPSALT